ncbi:MAG: galactokinase [Chloroflexi bacterium]|nr:galactokinase [Chloroflexota bacterium]
MKQRIGSAFRSGFSEEPPFFVRAPGRVNLIGEHTDYNDGFVLPMAIDRAIWFALRPRSDRRVRVHSLDFDETLDISLDDLRRGDGRWMKYISGMAWSLQQAGYQLCGWEGVASGNVPVASGLSSSAALELAAARAFSAVSGFDWDAVEMAQLALVAENQWVGVNCGIMDQLISAAGVAGHALLIDCRSLHTRLAPLPAGYQIVVLNSAAPRSLAESAYNLRRSECESAVRKLAAVYPEIQALRDVTPAMLQAEAQRLDAIELKRARHIVTEDERVLLSVEAMEQGDVARLGELMVASHVSLGDDYEVSSLELDTLVELALKTEGVLGARLTGAGFGGCAIALCKTEHAQNAATSIIGRYNEITGLPGEAYVTVASEGASLLIGEESLLT